MDRRTFLTTLALSIASNTVTGIPAIAGDDSWKQSFAKALRDKPYLLGFKGTQTTAFPKTSMKIDGILPKGLRGTFYRNGAARHEIGDFRYHHWFDGDGMVHAYHFSDAGITHQGRFVQTQKHVSEMAAGKALVQGFDTDEAFMPPAPNPDSVNVANINIIEHGGELLALWEGGSAYRLDRDTLETLGLKTWNEDTRGLPFGAHPRIDQNGTMWNFGYVPQADALVIYRINPDGSLHSYGSHRLAATPMIHDFMITENYLIFVLCPFLFDHANSGSFLDHFDWKPEDGNRAMIVDKNDLSKVKFVDLPVFWAFHYANAYEDGNLIRFQAPIYDDPTVMTRYFHEIMRGKEVDFSNSALVSGVINLTKGEYLQEAYPAAQGTEFPRIDPSYTGIKNRYAFAMQASGDFTNGGLSNRVLRFDNDSGKSTSYTYADNFTADEHIFVPDPQNPREGKGWMIGTAVDFENARTALSIFDAENLSAGPIARSYVDQVIPLGLHGNFTPTSS